jgi:hypothetical protein
VTLEVRRITKRIVTRFAMTIIGLSIAGETGFGQAAPPVRDLGPIVGKVEKLASFYGLYQFADGRVLVSDVGRRALMLYDSTMSNGVVVADTSANASFKYGIGSPLIPFSGDSVIFVDFASQSLLVIGPQAKVERVMAPPKAADLTLIRSSSLGVDPLGRVVYRGILRPPPRLPGQPMPTPIDSVPIVRGDFERRVVDTVVLMRVPGSIPWVPTPLPSGQWAFKSITTPLFWYDEWTLHADGTVAIVRGHDYHVDWISPDGAKTSSPKMPYDWRRLTDDDKQRMIDSAQRAFDTLPPAARGLTREEAIGRNVDITKMKIDTLAGGLLIVPYTLEFVPLSQIPDYIPPIRRGAVKADRDSSLWILPTTSARSRKGGLVYDVVNRAGVLYERVELPPGRSIAGFGRGGYIYLLSGDRTSGFTLERARVR